MKPIHAVLTLTLLAGALTGPAQAEPATAFQLNPRHDGATPDQPVLPLVKRWQLSIPYPSYPIIAQGKVFVTAGWPEDPRPDMYVWAFDGLTGRPAWSRPVPLGDGVYWAAPAYEDGTLFVLDETGRLQAITAATGNVRWTAQVPPGPFKSPPVALNGRVYLSTGDYANQSGTAYAFDGRTGQLLGSAPFRDGHGGSPAVTRTGVYFAGVCPHAYRFTPDLGQLKWHYGNESCEGPGITPVVSGRTLWVRDTFTWPNATLFQFDGVTGDLTGALAGDGPPPVVTGQQMLFLNQTTQHLEARDLGTGAITWQFSGDGGLITAPIIAGTFAFIGSEYGRLFALDRASGRIVWQASSDVSFDRVEEGGVYAPRSLAVADGLLVLPTSGRITVYTWDE